jgi:nucleotide-binding universal stress UspA family protein
MAGIKHIVTHFEGLGGDSRLAGFVGGLAKRFGATVEGVFVRPPPFVPTFADAGFGPQIIAAHTEALNRREAAAKAVFDGIAGAAGKTWRSYEGRAVTVVVERGRHADLIALGQPRPEEADVAAEYDIAAEVVMGTGRPVLILPYAGNFPAIGQRPLIAWKNSRESARALADALPLFAAGAKPTVLLVNPRESGQTLKQQEADLLGELKRHGFPGAVDVARTEDIEVGDVLLSAAADRSADLIVMGAYGRSRFRELVLGGATHDILKHMTAPVLMSH